MLSKLLAALGNANDVRSFAAVVAAVLTTIFNPAHSTVVTSIVDGLAGGIVMVDTALVHLMHRTPAATTTTTATTTASTVTTPHLAG
ncbi:MAG: hypothetical protein ACYCV4_18895 [Dermatophilaceae bacterium]